MFIHRSFSSSSTLAQTHRAYTLQAIDWLKATIKASGATCDVVAQHDPHFLNSLELAVRFGTVRVLLGEPFPPAG
jgi:hypothetical protein